MEQTTQRCEDNTIEASLTFTNPHPLTVAYIDEHVIQRIDMIECAECRQERLMLVSDGRRYREQQVESDTDDGIVVDVDTVMANV
jgi:hypothetical protein